MFSESCVGPVKQALLSSCSSSFITYTVIVKDRVPENVYFSPGFISSAWALNPLSSSWTFLASSLALRRGSDRAATVRFVIFSALVHWVAVMPTTLVEVFPIITQREKLQNDDWSVKMVFFLNFACEGGKITGLRLVLRLPSNSLFHLEVSFLGRG